MMIHQARESLAAQAVSVLSAREMVVLGLIILRLLARAVVVSDRMTTHQQDPLEPERAVRITLVTFYDSMMT